MRGIASIAKLVTPASASARTVSAAVSGARKPISTEPRSRRPISSGLGAPALGPHLPREAGAERGAGLLVIGVRLVRGGAGAGLDGHLDAALPEPLDDLR